MGACVCGREVSLPARRQGAWMGGRVQTTTSPPPRWPAATGALGTWAPCGHMFMYIYIYIYIERERDTYIYIYMYREREYNICYTVLHISQRPFLLFVLLVSCCVLFVLICSDDPFGHWGPLRSRRPPFALSMKQWNVTAKSTRLHCRINYPSYHYH